MKVPSESMSSSVAGVFSLPISMNLAYNITMMYDDSAANFDTMGVFKNFYSQRVYNIIADGYGDPQYEDYDVCVACSKAVNRFASSGRLKNTLDKYPRLGGYEWIYYSMS